jgi:hypothetical protein
LPSRRSDVPSGRCARARWCSDARLGTSRHGWPLRWRGAMDLGSWRYNPRCRRSRRCGDTRRRARGHGRTLRWGSRTERRRDGARHCGRGRWAGHSWSRWSGHGRWWSCWSGCWRSHAAWAMTSSLLGGRASAHRYCGDTEKQRCNANGARKHDLNSLVLRRPET